MKLSKPGLLFFCLATFFSNCSTRERDEVSISLLEEAYKNSKVNVDAFLKKWAEYSQNLACQNNSIMQNEFAEIHRLVFNPFDYNKFGLKDWTWTRYQGSKYVVVQTEIPYEIVAEVDTTTFSENTFTDTLKGFCPNVVFDSVKLLALTHTYKAALENFFGSWENGKLVEEPGRAIFREKRKFLNNYVPLAIGYDYRVILTHPLVTGIQISEDFKLAKVDFQVDESGLQSILKKEKSKWVILATKTVWIE